MLIYGELPTADELSNWDDNIREHTMLHEDIKDFFNGFPRNAHPMAVLSSAVSALSTFYADSLDPFDEEQVRARLDHSSDVQGAGPGRLRV